MRRHRIGMVMGGWGILGAAMVLGTPAHAFDVTGLWKGSIRCAGQVISQRRSFSRDDVELRVSGSTLQLESRIYRAAFLPDGRNPDRGAMALIGCSTSLFPEFRGQMGRLKVTTKPANGTGVISGQLFSIGDSIAESFFSCKWKFRRVSTVDPGIPPCEE